MPRGNPDRDHSVVLETVVLIGLEVLSGVYLYLAYLDQRRIIIAILIRTMERKALWDGIDYYLSEANFSVFSHHV